MLDFDEYCEILKKWVSDGYPKIVDDILREKIAQFEYKLYDEEQYDTNAKIKRDKINEIIRPKINPNDCNVSEYYKEILKKYGVDDQDIESFIKVNSDIKVEIEAPTYRLYNYLLSDYKLDNNTYNILHETVSDIIKNITSSSMEPNISLAKSLKEKPIIFSCEIGKYNACMDISIVDGKERPTLWLRVPENNIPNKDSLASTICHELGHWLDLCSRDFNCYYEARDLAECFADIIGMMLAQNAGYNYGEFIERIARFVEEFDTPELLKYKNMVQKRYDFINQVHKRYRRNYD